MDCSTAQAPRFEVGKDRLQRIWRREGLMVPQKQRPRGRLWLGDGSRVRLRAQRANHVWSYDFAQPMTQDGGSLRMMTLVDEYSREALSIRVARCLRSRQELRRRLQEVGAQTLFIRLGSRWENGYYDSFNGKLRDELLDGEIF